MKRIKSTLNVAMWLLLSTFICGSTIVFTSCGNNTLEEILGAVDNPAPTATINFAESEKWWGTNDGKFTLAVTNTGDGVVTYSSSNPSAASVDPTTGEVTPGYVTTTTVETVTITATVADSKNATYPTKTAQYTLHVGGGYRYLKWDNPSKKVVYGFDDSASDNDLIDSNTGAAMKLQGGGAVKFVKGHITISGNITIGNDLLLVLLDGAKLEINGQLGVATSKVLSISAQSEGEEKGELVVKHDIAAAIICPEGMNIYGGKITAENTGTSGNHGIGVVNSPLNIYGGDVTAKGGDTNTSSGGDGIFSGSGEILITGKAKVNAIGGNSSSGSDQAGFGINANVTVSGEAYVTAKGGNTNASISTGGMGIFVLKYKGGKFEAYGGKTGSETTYQWGIGGTLFNESSAPVDFETSTDGETWNGTYTLSNASSENSAATYTTPALQKRGIRRK